MPINLLLILTILGFVFLLYIYFQHSRAMLAYIRQNKSGRIKNVASIYYSLGLSIFIALTIFYSVSIVSILYYNDLFVKFHLFLFDILSRSLFFLILCMGLTGLIFARDIVIFFKLRREVKSWFADLGRAPTSSVNDRFLGISFRIINLFVILIFSIVLASFKNASFFISIFVASGIFLFSYIVLLETEQKKIV